MKPGFFGSGAGRVISIAVQNAVPTWTVTPRTCAADDDSCPEGRRPGIGRSAGKSTPALAHTLPRKPSDQTAPRHLGWCTPTTLRSSVQAWPRQHAAQLASRQHRQCRQSRGQHQMAGRQCSSGDQRRIDASGASCFGPSPAAVAAEKIRTPEVTGRPFRPVVEFAFVAGRKTGPRCRPAEEPDRQP